MAAPVGAPVDQRTGRQFDLGAVPTAAQLQTDRASQVATAKREREELIAKLEASFIPQATSEAGVVDVRKLNGLVKAELDRLEGLPEADRVLPPLPRKATRPPDKALAEATKEAGALMAELDARAAWLFRDILATNAVRARYLEAGERLIVLVRQHRLSIDVGRYTTLAVRAQELAGQQIHFQSRDPEAWRENLPELEDLELPAVLRPAPAPLADSSVSQLTRKPFDPTVSADHDLRMAAGSTPADREADGTLTGVSLRHSRVGNDFVPAPRTEAQERAARKRIADELAAEEGG